MNDYWNDPPESPEPPECCGEFMEIGENGCWCPNCGGFIAFRPELDFEPPNLEEAYPEDPPIKETCPHGKKPEHCDTFYFLSDLAYDASRERSR